MGNLDLLPGEDLLKKGQANHWVNPANAQGGYLLLTSRRLLFKAHFMNVQPRGLAVDIRQIDGACLGEGMKQIAVELKNGRWEKFGVYRRKDWVGLINDMADVYRP